MCVNQTKNVTQTSGAKYLFVQQEESWELGGGGFAPAEIDFALSAE